MMKRQLRLAGLVAGRGHRGRGLFVVRLQLGTECGRQRCPAPRPPLAAPAPRRAPAPSSPTRARSPSGTPSATSRTSSCRSRSAPGRRSIPASPSRRTSSRSMAPTRSTPMRPTPASRRTSCAPTSAGPRPSPTPGMLLDLTSLLPGRLPEAVPAGPDGHRDLQGRDVRRPAGHRRPRSPVQQDRADAAGLVGPADQLGRARQPPATRSPTSPPEEVRLLHER